MRKIKFRAWIKNKKIMVDVKELNYDNCGLNSFKNNHYFYEILYRGVNDENQKEHLYVHKSDCEIMQYTNLKDDNGKEIYEGDILKITCNFSLRDGVVTSKVFFEEGSFTTDEWLLIELSRNRKNGEQRFEVIGNIYENREILNT